MSDKKKLRKKKAQLETSSEVLKSFFQKSPLSQQFTRWKVWNEWAELVGPQISQYSSPIQYDQGTLTLWVAHPVHMQNLQFIELELKGKINKFVGRRWVHRVRYDLNPKNKPENISEHQLQDIISQSGDPL